MSYKISNTLPSLLKLISIGIIIFLFQPVRSSAQSLLPDPLEAGWMGHPVCEVLLENEKLRTLRCSFPPGVGHDRHFHAAHFGYTLSGSRFRITDAKGVREVDVLTGSHFYNEGIEWHEVLNIGDSTAVFLIMEPKGNTTSSE